MKTLLRASRLLCFGCAVSLALLGGKQASAQCPNVYYSGGWYSAGGYTYYAPAPVNQQAATSPAPSAAKSATPSAAPSNGQVAQSTSETYQSFSATPSPVYAVPTYAAPSYPAYGGYYGSSYASPTYYGGYIGGYGGFGYTGGGYTHGGTAGHPY